MQSGKKPGFKPNTGDSSISILNNSTNKQHAPSKPALVKEQKTVAPPAPVKVVVRRLSPQFTVEDFTALMGTVAAEAGLEERQGAWTILYYAPGKISKKRGKVTGAGYLTVDRDAGVEPSTIVDRIAAAVHSMSAAFQSHERADVSGARPLVELAPYQRVFRAKPRRDNFDGTYDKDPEYKAFCEALAVPVEKLPSADVQLDQRDAEGIKEVKPTSALVQYLRERRALRSRPLRPPSFSDGRSGGHKSSTAGPGARHLPQSRSSRDPRERHSSSSSKAHGSGDRGRGHGSSSASSSAHHKDSPADIAREKLRAKKRAKKALLREERHAARSSGDGKPHHRGSRDEGSSSGRPPSSADSRSGRASAGAPLPSPPTQQQQQQQSAGAGGSASTATTSTSSAGAGRSLSSKVSWSEAAGGAASSAAAPAAAASSEKSAHPRSGSASGGRGDSRGRSSSGRGSGGRNSNNNSSSSSNSAGGRGDSREQHHGREHGREHGGRGSGGRGRNSSSGGRGGRGGGRSSSGSNSGASSAAGGGSAPTPGKVVLLARNEGS